MGTLDKIALEFAVPFWPEEIHYMGYLTGSIEHTLEIWNMQVVTGAPVLVAFCGGRVALSLEAEPDAAAADYLLGQLRGMFGPDISEPRRMIRTRWFSDPYAGGSYSHVAPGARPANYDALARPVDERLFFAGEATHRRYPATVHGAYLSGLRAAEQVLGRSQAD